MMKHEATARVAGAAAVTGGGRAGAPGRSGAAPEQGPAARQGDEEEPARDPGGEAVEAAEGRHVLAGVSRAVRQVSMDGGEARRAVTGSGHERGCGGRGGSPAMQEADAEGDPGRRRRRGEEGGMARGRGDVVGPLVRCVWEREGEVGRAVVEDEREREMGSSQNSPWQREGRAEGG